MVLHIDPRTKLYLLLASNFLLFFHVDQLTEALFTIFLCFLFLTSEKKKTAVRFLVIYSVLLLIDVYVVGSSNNIFIVYISAIAVTMRMILPCIISGSYAFTTTSVAEFVCALRKMHISENIIIPCMVIIRFFPMIQEDYRQIKNAMALKGIDHKNPMQKLEYVLIPLLMNTNNVAEDLTCAALTKGLSMKNRHTSLVQIRFRFIDLMIVVCAAMIIMLDLGGML